MFQDLTGSIQADFVRYIYRVEFVNQDEQQQQQAPQPQRLQDNRAEVEQAGGVTAAGRRPPTPTRRSATRPPATHPAPAAAARSTRSATAPRSDDTRPCRIPVAITLCTHMSESTEPLRKLRERVLAAKEFL